MPDLSHGINMNDRSYIRLSYKIWGQIDKVRTFLLESVKDEDSFLRDTKFMQFS